ncbi:RNase P subunit p30 [Seminavis robusta]|uniref:RNase P subunit p30 n=1 Tax=Seminavis robusta TaxID=568900 RepID=A0A9N8DHS8_9STRA|nr:RNase P subunit p30 [Seminavis robusta]|eukprot:Sro72_g039820.1 RNase P subunit p30 (359) ;mRNA; f:50925-52001
MSSDGRSRRKRRHESSCNNNKSTYDLFVPLPKEAAAVQIPQFLQRLTNTGYTHVALTHTVYGVPRKDVDEADTAIPKELFRQSSANKTIQVLRRLHAVLENLSDVAHYVQQHANNDNDNSSLLQGYDLISVAPRNDAIFQSACKNATAADIIVLDYYSSSTQLPFRIRPTDIRAALARNAVLELPYAPAILNPKRRKGLVHASRLLQFATSSNKSNHLLVSSGPRLGGSNQEDVGVMAFRTPGDLENVLQVVLKLDDPHATIHSTGAFVLQQAHARRWGKQSITVTDMVIQQETDDLQETTTKDDCSKDDEGKHDKKPPAKTTKKDDKRQRKETDNESDDDGAQEEEKEIDGDGFIAF